MDTPENVVITGARRVVDDDEPVRDASQVEAATRRMDGALELLTKQAGMLEDRLARYLAPTPETTRLSPQSDSAQPVEAAMDLLRQAGVVERVADLLGEVRERFEG